MIWKLITGFFGKYAVAITMALVVAAAGSFTVWMYNWSNNRCEARINEANQEMLLRAEEEQQAITDQWQKDVRWLRTKIAKLEGTVNDVIPENPECDSPVDLVTRVLNPARVDSTPSSGAFE